MIRLSLLASVIMLGSHLLFAQDHTLTAKFSAMSPHLNQPFKARVVDVATGNQVGEQVVAKITSTEFTLNFGKILVMGKNYNLDFYADVDNNGYTFPGDHAWRTVISNVQTDIAATFSHNGNFVDIKYPAVTALKTVTLSDSHQLWISQGLLHWYAPAGSTLRIYALDGSLLSSYTLRNSDNTMLIPSSASIAVLESKDVRSTLLVSIIQN